MDSPNKIALLIDADNAQPNKLESVIEKISSLGRIAVRRAYGNWRKENLKSWEGELKRLSIKAEQQFDYVAGKNATDMAMTIDALDLFYRGGCNTFVLVSSDSDYTPLAIYLRENGAFVLGAGRERTPEAYAKAAMSSFSLRSRISSRWIC